MSSRLKERREGGGKIAAYKPQNPPKSNSPRPKPPIATVAGKENLPNSRRIPAEVPAVRWSMSSISRGKSPNPSDLKRRASETLDSKEFGTRARVLGRCQQERKGKDAKLKPNTLRRSSSEVNPGKIGPKDRNFGIDSCKSTNDQETVVAISKKIDLKSCNANDLKGCANSRVPKESASKSTMETYKEKDNLLLNLKNHDLRSHDEINKDNASKKQYCEVVKLNGIGNSARLEEKCLGCIKVFDNSSENCVEAVNKYPSKLHDKLAALEGRVQRIASHIKRTKEILDQNDNQTESKLILSDIQKKISGIENAVSSVIDGNGIELGISEIPKDDSLRAETLRGQNLNMGLNLDALEASFFPHQKLITNRMVLDCKPDLLKPNPMDENPIAVEFLASLNGDQNDIKKDDRVLKSELIGLEEMGMEKTTSGINFESRKLANLQCNEDIALVAGEKFDDFDDQENKPSMMVFEEAEDSFKSQMFEISHKSSTGGWFVSEGEAVLLAHNDSSCSYYDIANCEEKMVYMPPEGVSNNLWGDCWLIRAPGADGSSGRFVVAASAGSTLESGFCSWDFYTKNIQAFRVEDGIPTSSSMSSSRTALSPLTNAGLLGRSASCTMPNVESRQWWYTPCGPLLISTASGQKNINAYDIRDGEIVMKWDVNSPVVGMEYSSPLQWRSRGKVIVAETEAISLWDVNSLTPGPLLSVATAGKKINCLHVNNTDAEIGGGVRQRPRSSEVEGNDGVFCTEESINVFDFRLPSGVGLKISRQGAKNVHSIFACGDSIFIASTGTRLALSNGPRSCVQQFSSRNGKLIATYTLPDSNCHPHHPSITQLWGRSNFVMGISGMGLFVFDALKDQSTQSFSNDRGNTVEVKETVGPDDLYHPTFDYLGSRVLIISRDRPAMWRYLL